MAENSQIQWTEHTWNPWHGCTKVSPGCKFCYMYRDKERYGQDPTTVLRSKTKFRDPLKWKDPARVFTCSWSDWFIEEADEWRDDAWRIIKDTPHLTYQILTKRPENIADRLPVDWGEGYKNVWLGVSVENQDVADTRIPQLLKTPAQVRFLSVEPLLDAVSFRWAKWDGNYEPGWRDRAHNPNHLDGLRKLDWIIVGGESGNESGRYRYRPSHLEWYAEVVRQCGEAGVPVFVKQLGTYLAKELDLRDHHGGDINEWPEYLRVREFPI